MTESRSEGAARAAQTMLEGLYVRVAMLDPAPDEPEAFKAWCEKYGCNYLGEESGRRAWCGEFSTYLRGADGIAELSSGERFLYYDEDIVRVDAEAGA